MSLPAPETERLLFRRAGLGDFEDIASLWSDPVVVRHFGRAPYSAEENWGRLLLKIGHWQALGYGYWVLHERDTGRFVGEIGFADLRRDIDPPLCAVPEAGWALMPWAHGRGLAGEAMRAALAWLESGHGARRTCCIIDPGNEPSLRLADRCGYRETGRTTYRDRPIAVLLRDAGTRAG